MSATSFLLLTLYAFCLLSPHSLSLFAVILNYHYCCRRCGSYWLRFAALLCCAMPCRGSTQQYRTLQKYCKLHAINVRPDCTQSELAVAAARHFQVHSSAGSPACVAVVCLLCLPEVYGTAQHSTKRSRQACVCVMSCHVLSCMCANDNGGSGWPVSAWCLT